MINNCQYTSIKKYREIMKSVIDRNIKKKIEDIEIPEYEVDTLVYVNNKTDEEDMMNIYSKIENIMTDDETINNDRYKNLGNNIRNIIIDGKIYKIEDEINMIRFMKKETFVEYIKRKEERGDEREYNENGDTIMMMCCKYNLEEESMRIMDKYDREEIKKIIYMRNEYRLNGFEEACNTRMKKIIKRILDLLTEEEINDTKDEKIFRILILNNNELFMYLLRRLRVETIERYFDISLIAWMMSAYKEKMIIEVMKRMTENKRKKIIIEKYSEQDMMTLCDKYVLRELKEYIINI